jgi:ribosomal protein L40E
MANMNKDFVKLAQKIVKERGKDILNNGKLTKALFMDYSHGEYKNEINLLLKTIELGYPNRIQSADDVDTIRLILSRQLNENHFIVEEMAVRIVSLLIALIKDVNYIDVMQRKDTKSLDKKIEQKTTAITPPSKNQQEINSISNKKLLEEDIIKRSLEIWICGRCNTKNDFDYDYCKKCGKEFNPPMVSSEKRVVIKISPGLWEQKKK